MGNLLVAVVLSTMPCINTDLTTQAYAVLYVQCSLILNNNLLWNIYNARYYEKTDIQNSGLNSHWSKQSGFLKECKGYFQITEICIRSHRFEIYFPVQNPREKEIDSVITTRGLDGRLKWQHLSLPTFPGKATANYAGCWVCDIYTLVSLFQSRRHISQSPSTLLS